MYILGGKEDKHGAAGHGDGESLGSPATAALDSCHHFGSIQEGFERCLYVANSL